MIYDKIRNIVLNYEEYSKRFLKIRDKKGDIVQFNRNAAQKKLFQIIQERIKQGKPPRILILKARQLGFSTETEAEIFHRTATQFNRNALIVAHDIDSSTNLFNIFKRFYENLPEPLKPKIKSNNEKKLIFSDLHSEIKIASAERREKMGRSATIQDLHISEVAFFPNAADTMLALLQVVPNEINTLVIAETTANGIGGWFYDTWKAALNGENDWYPLFFAWFDNPQYKIAFESEAEEREFVRTMSDYEKKVKEANGLTNEQMNWWRYFYRNYAGGNLDMMKQEYPSNAEEAFIATGRPRFDNTICYTNYLAAEKEEYRRGDIIDGEFVENDRGFIKIFDEIKVDNLENYVFAAGVDVAEGLAQGDYSVIKIKDRRTNKVSMTWHGHIAPDLLAEEMLKIQKYLKGKIYFNVERNNHGLTTIVKADELGVNLMYQQNFEKGYETNSSEIGFITNRRTKRLVIDELDIWIREGILDDPEKEFWAECLTFVRNPNGEASAEGKDKDPATKNYDDRVMAQAMMLMCDKWMPAYYVKKVDNLPDWAKKKIRRKRTAMSA